MAWRDIGQAKPLSFLDHRIRCGNSLVGVLDPEVLAEGIPDEAFTAVTGDDKKVAAAFKKRNKLERTSKQRGFSFEPADHSDEYAKAKRELTDITEDSAAAVRRKARACMADGEQGCSILMMKLWRICGPPSFISIFLASTIRQYVQRRRFLISLKMRRSSPKSRRCPIPRDTESFFSLVYGVSGSISRRWF